MKGLSPRTWELVQQIFPADAETAGLLLVSECGQNLPFCEDRDEYQLERLRFAALKISGATWPGCRKPSTEGNTTGATS